MLAGLLGATALGCGGDDDVAVATTTSAPEVVTEEVPTDVTDDVVTEEVASSVASSMASSGDVEAWCLGWNSEAPFEESQTPEEFEAEFAAGLERLEALLDVAPDEIVEASASLVDAQRVLGEHFADYDWDLDTPRLDPALADTPTRIAVGELEAFSADNC